MFVYLSSRYSRKDEMNEYADRIEAAGHIVRSRWHRLGHDLPADADAALTRSERVRFAEEDIADLFRSEVCITFTEAGADRGSGGRHVEFGYALAAGLYVSVVGPAENVFHELAGPGRHLLLPSFDGVIAMLDDLEMEVACVPVRSASPGENAAAPDGGGG